MSVVGIYYLIGLIMGVLFYSNCICHGNGDKGYGLFAFIFSILAGLAMWPLLIVLWVKDN